MSHVRYLHDIVGRNGRVTGRIQVNGIQAKTRSGHTLIELVMAMSAATMLMGGLASTIYISSRALDSGGSAPVQTFRAAETLDDVMADLQYATSITERTANAVTFDVPDRDGDDMPETIRYSWSGTPGDPLSMEYNGGAAAVLMENVQQFNLNYLLRSVTGMGFAQGVIADDGLVAYWRFDEGTGSVANDSSGYQNHGDLISGPSWVAGTLGDALLFDGSGAHVDAGTFDVTGSEISISAWFKADDFGVNDGRIVSKATGMAEQDHFWMLSTIQSGSNMRLRLRIRTGGTTTTLIAGSGNLSPGVWTHAVAVYDGTNMVLYKDGVEVGRTGKSGTLDTNPATSVWIGDNPGPDRKPFDGAIDEVRIYNCTLSADEVVEVMNDTGP